MLRRTFARRTAQNTFGATMLPHIVNEPMLDYRPGSPEAKRVRAEYDKIFARCASPADVPDVPLVIGNQKIYNQDKRKREIPSDHATTLHTYNWATPAQLDAAVASAAEAHKTWSRTPFLDRAAIFLRASELLCGKYRARVIAETGANQSKNIRQAEIDAIAELADFWRMGVKFAADMYTHDQPQSPAHGTWNTVEHRPLEGFVCGISPFNFTAIGGHLGSIPALMGNTVLWKPSDDALLSNYTVFQILEEAGMPPGVINFVPTSAENIARGPLSHKDLSCVCFTGSTATFNKIYQNIACQIDRYKNFPKITGETGGKNFHLVHPSADMGTVVATTVRSAFEFQGQKCSACSRCYVPASKWAEFRDRMVTETNKLKVGGPEDFQNMVTAVISEASFNKSSKYTKIAQEDPSCTFLAGGKPDRTKGWFIPPTIVQTTDLNCRLLKEEIFGPILTCYVYDDSKPGFWADICKTVDEQAEYGLTGAIYALDRAAVIEARDEHLRWTAGNLYINDKSTGSVVGQQPFGGSRHSGTNDKPGSVSFLNNFVTPRAIKETLEPLTDITYAHQQ